MFQVPDGREDGLNFMSGEDDGETAAFFLERDFLDFPAAFENVLVKKSQGGESLIEVGTGDVFFIEEIQQVISNLLFPQLRRRPAHVSDEIFGAAQVTSARVGAESPQLHF